MIDPCRYGRIPAASVHAQLLSLTKNSRTQNAILPTTAIINRADYRVTKDELGSRLKNRYTKTTHN